MAALLADPGCFDNLAEAAICHVRICRRAIPLAEKGPGKFAREEGVRW